MGRWQGNRRERKREERKGQTVAIFRKTGHELLADELPVEELLHTVWVRFEDDQRPPLGKGKGEVEKASTPNLHLNQRVSQPLTELVEAHILVSLLLRLALQAVNRPNITERDAVDLTPRRWPDTAETGDDDLPHRLHLDGDLRAKDGRGHGLRGRVGKEVVDEVAGTGRGADGEERSVGGVGDNGGEADEELGAAVDAGHGVRGGNLHRIGDLLRGDFRETDGCGRRSSFSE
jgi:hypothetical protein